MKILIICLFLFFDHAFTVQHFVSFLTHNPPPPTGPERRSEVSMNYFSQKLDNFESNDETTWKQKYFVNTEFFNNASNNVAFLFLGGESPASESWMVHGSWIESAGNYGALLFQLEHRYYGESQPTSNLATENLRYLSSQQALADAANFIKGMNEEYSLDPDVKWIAFGGSYSGSLAAWLRLKYPDLVHGAVSSSGPLLAKLDFSEYYQVVIDDLATTGPKCVNNLKTAMSQVEDLLNNPTLSDSVTSILNLCDPIEEVDSDDANMHLFYNRLIEPFAFTAQFNGRVDNTVNDLCDLLNNETRGREIVRLSDVLKEIYGDRCIGYNYDNQVELLRDISLTQGVLRQWTYQTCTEYGWYQTSNREDKILGRGCPVDYYTKLCSDLFGPEFNTSFINNRIDLTNADYGGIDIDVSNVVYVHGSMDPWHAVGLTKTTHADSPVIYIQGTSHCANMYGTTVDELPQLTGAKKEVDRLIGKWLGFN